MSANGSTGAFPSLGKIEENSTDNGQRPFSLLLQQISTAGGELPAIAPDELPVFVPALDPTTAIPEIQLPLNGNILPVVVTAPAEPGQPEMLLTPQPQPLPQQLPAPLPNSGLPTAPLSLTPDTTTASIELTSRTAQNANLASGHSTATVVQAAVVDTDLESKLLRTGNPEARSRVGTEMLTTLSPEDAKTDLPASLNGNSGNSGNSGQAGPGTSVSSSPTLPFMSTVQGMTAGPTQGPTPTGSPGATMAAPGFTLNQPVADPQWGSELGQRLVWMTERGIGRAEIRMNPPELGPVEVRIAVANDDARVAFNVQHGATRDALEAAMPRLREMFAAQGLNLSDANVSEQSKGQQGNSTGGASDESGGKLGDDSFDNDADQLLGSATTITRGLVDTYA